MEQKCLEILGFTERPTDRELKKAYKTLVKKYHPDVTGGETSQKYIEVDTAYKYLTGKITYREAEAILYPNNYENRSNSYSQQNTDPFSEEFYRNFNNYTTYYYTDSSEYDENGYYRNKYTYNLSWLRWLPLILFVIFVVVMVLFFKVVSFLFFTPFGLILLSIYLVWNIFFKNKN